MTTRENIENLIYRLKNNLNKDVIDDVNRLFFSFSDEVNDDIDIILILGSSLINRAKKGLEVYKKSFKPIIISGGVERFESISEASKFREYLLDNGVRCEDIYVENMSSNTYENLDNSFKLINDIDKNIRNILIVTSSLNVTVNFTFSFVNSSGSVSKFVIVGTVASNTNVTVVVFPASSVTVTVYVPSFFNSPPLLNSTASPPL